MSGPDIGALFAGAIAHQQRGDIAAARDGYRAVLAQTPDHADSLHQLGLIELQSGQPASAADLFGRAVAARPDFAAAHRSLGSTLRRLGNHAAAIEALRRAMAIEETAETKVLLYRALVEERSVETIRGHRDLLIRAIGEPWGDTRSMVALAGNVLLGDPVFARCIAAVRQAPAQPSPETVFEPGDLKHLAGDPLLLTLLESELVPDDGFERLVTAMRHALLRSAATPEDDGTLALHCALARQCFHSDYIHPVSDDERTRVATLREELAQAAASSTDIAPSRIAALASYAALDGLPEADALLRRTWPAPVAALLDQQIETPRAVRRIAAAMASLTPIDDAVSQDVARQYEEMPYPRWDKFPPAPPKVPLAARLRTRFPHAAIRLPIGALDMLIAGCGTGRQAAIAAYTHSDLRIAAIDISRSSLGYAKLQSERLGMSGIEFAQADILAVDTIGRSFDVIESVGVLHHMADPLKGWRKLLAVLRPHGVMRIGLYSEFARREVVAGRRIIAERGYGTTPDEIRRCRQELLALPDGAPAKAITKWRDFYNLNECRDLLFHVREHRFTIPQIARFLADSGLELIGIETDPYVLHHYRQRFPGDAAATSLDNWHQFEASNPDLFANMYVFWVQRAAAEAGA
jgi:SAM-dependent methyltransferase/tetratricopeptide (TPR) repeat protein